MSEAVSTAAEHRWYVIHTYSGFEAKVRDSLLERMAAVGWAEKISEVLVPSEEIVELKKYCPFCRSHTAHKEGK